MGCACSKNKVSVNKINVSSWFKIHFIYFIRNECVINMQILCKIIHYIISF